MFNLSRSSRLLLVLGVFLFLGASLAGLYLYRMQQRSERIATARETGLAAFAEKDYPKTIEAITPALRDLIDDPDVLYAYGIAHLETPVPDRGHLAVAYGRFRDLFRIAPDYRDVADQLLKLAERYARPTDLLDFANRTLEMRPNDPRALRARALAYDQLGRRAEAISAAEAALKFQPEDAPLQIMRLRAMRGQGVELQVITDQARAVQAQQPSDPRFSLPLAYAYLLAQRIDEGRRLLTQLAEHPPEYPEFTIHLVHYLDGAGLFPQATALVARGEAAFPDYEFNFADIHTQRLFDAGLTEQALDRLAAQERSEMTTPHLVVRHFCEQVSPARRDQVSLTLAELQNRKQEPIAQAWARLLGDTDRRPTETARRARELLALEQRDALGQHVLAQSLAAFGEYEAAQAAWKLASEMRPAWGTPYARQAEVLLQIGQPRQALPMAEGAVRRQPQALTPALVFARSLAQTVDMTSASQVAAYEQVLNNLYQVAPNRPDVALLRLELLARTQRKAQASEVAARLLEQTETLPRQEASRLSALITEYGLELPENAQAQLDTAAGSVQRNVILEATATAEAGNVDAALQQLDAAAAAAPEQEASAWRQTRARLLDRVGDPRAADAWRAASDAAPSDANLHLAAADSPAVQANATLMEQVLTRLEQATGPEAVAWRTARARWIVHRPNPTPESLREAARLAQEAITRAPNRTIGHLLLARAQELQGSLSPAMESLRQVLTLEPDSHQARLELARLLVKADRREDSIPLYLEVGRSATADLPLRRTAASQLAQVGAAQQAIELLENMIRQQPTTEDRLALARIYLQLGQHDRAITVTESLLKTPTPEIINFAASLYRAKGDMNAAEAVLSKMDEAGVSPSERAIILARNHAQRGEVDQAILQYETAVAADANLPGAWAHLVHYLLLQNRVEDALAANERARTAVPQAPIFQSIASSADQLRKYSHIDEIRQIVSQLLVAAGIQATLPNHLWRYAELRDREAGPAELLAVLVPWADEIPQDVALQLLTAQTQMQAGQAQAAADRMARAMVNHPTSAAPAQLATQAWLQVRNWPNALVAARAWQDRTLQRVPGADLAAAQAQMELGRPGDAEALLRPYLAAVREDPNANAPMMVVYVRSLTAQNRPREVEALLEPMAPESAQWRRIWVELAAAEARDTRTGLRWLDLLGSQMIPADNMPEQVVLLSGYERLGRRFNDRNVMSQALDRAKRITAAAEVPAIAWFLQAGLEDQLGDLAAAETSYRKALAIDGDLAAASNNLAMVLIRRDQQPAEAITLAEKAHASQPQNTAFLDTLAQAQVKSGQREDAIKTIEKAMALEPNNPQWRLTRDQIRRGSSQ